MNESQMQRVEPNVRVAVYPQHNRYYEAVVLQVDHTPNPSILVRYVDDGREECIDPRQDTFRVIGEDKQVTWSQISMNELLSSSVDDPIVRSSSVPIWTKAMR